MAYLAVANWKMNGLNADLNAFSRIKSNHSDVLICPPATLIPQLRMTLGTQIMIGAQDCHFAENGAHTGEISAQMLKSAGASYVILGHSERRVDQGETNGLIHSKIKAAWRADLVAILCIGESLEERKSGQTIDVLKQQLIEGLPQAATTGNTIIAYEPIWAIGTGEVASIVQIDEAHNAIQNHMIHAFNAEFRLLYGGSMKPQNAGEIIAIQNVHGGLIGGASLKADDFSKIIDAFDAHASQKEGAE